jgi:hypothetical protein
MSKRPFLSLFLTITLLLQALLPFAAQYNSESAQTASASNSLFGETVLICTGEGFRWVKWADLQSGKEKPAPHQKKYQCALCYVAAHGTAIAANPPALEAPVALAALRTLPSYRHRALGAEMLWPQRQSRAPPVFLLV